MTEDQRNSGVKIFPAQAEPESFTADNHIAHKLKALYITVERQPIPDIFLDLLEKLDAAEQRHR